MHLLQVHHALAPPFADIARSYVAAAARNGWEVHTVVLRGAAEGLDGTVTALELPHSALSGLKLGALTTFRRALTARPSLVIAHRFKPLYLAALGTSAPVLGVAHEFGFCARASRRLLLQALGSRVSLAGVSRAVAAELSAVVGASRVHHLPNVLDLANPPPLLDRDAARAALLGARAADDRRWVAFFGRLHRKKSLRLLLEAFAELRRAPRFADVRLLLVGDGPERVTLGAQVERLGLENDVVFAGFVPDARRYLAGVDLLVQCSGPAEAFGMTVLEAVWAGIPAVTSDVGGPAELFPGLLPRFRSGDPASLAATMAAALDDPAELRPARDELERRYSVPALADRLARLADELVH